MDSLIEAVKEKSIRSEGMCGGVRGGELQKLVHLPEGLVGGGGRRVSALQGGGLVMVKSGGQRRACVLH